MSTSCISNMATGCWIYVYLCASVVQLCMGATWKNQRGYEMSHRGLSSASLNKDGYDKNNISIVDRSNAQNSRRLLRSSAILLKGKRPDLEHTTAIVKEQYSARLAYRSIEVLSGHRNDSYHHRTKGTPSLDLGSKVIYRQPKSQVPKFNYGVPFANKSIKDLPISSVRNDQYRENKSTSSDDNFEWNFQSIKGSAARVRSVHGGGVKMSQILPTQQKISADRRAKQIKINEPIHRPDNSSSPNELTWRPYFNKITQIYGKTLIIRKTSNLRNPNDLEDSTRESHRLYPGGHARRSRRDTIQTKPKAHEPPEDKAKDKYSWKDQTDTMKLNMSESSLSYRAKGQMGYVESSKTRSIGYGEIRERPTNVDPDHEDQFPKTNSETTPSDVSTTSSVETSTGDQHVLLLGLPHETVMGDVLNTNSSSEPENEVEVEPEGEPENEPEPEPENEGSVTESPNGYKQFVDCDGGLCYAEPYPDWTKAKPLYGGAWEFHVYGIGIAFALISIYSLICMILLRQKANLLSKGYFMSLNTMLLLMGTTRAIYLLVDGYDSNRIFQPVISYMLINFSFPCLTSAFSILFLAMLRATKMQIVSKRIQKPSVLIGIIVFHFFLSFTVDIIVGLVYNLRVLFLVCQIAFIVWGAFLFCGYFYLFWKLYNSPSMAYNTHRDSSYHHATNYSLSGVVPSGRDSTTEHKSRLYKLKSFHLKVMLNLALKVTLSTALLGTAYIVVVIYGMVDVFNVFAKKSPEPWPFWAYHFCIRLIELAICATMSFVATQPLRYNGGVKSTKLERPKSDCLDFLYFIPCYRLCMEHDTEKDVVSTSADRCIAADGVFNRTDSEISKDGDDSLNVSVV